MSMIAGLVPTVDAYAGLFKTTEDVLAKPASVLPVPPQSPLTVSIVPSEFTWVTIAT